MGGQLGQARPVRRRHARQGRRRDAITADRSFDVPASSFVGVRGNDIWVGLFARSGAPRAYPYRVADDGALTPAGRPVRVPTMTQGMAVTARRFIFSRSFGRDADGRIESHARRDGDADGPRLTAPNMAEGMVAAGGEVHVIYESGSALDDVAGYRVRTIHHAPAGGLGG